MKKILFITPFVPSNRGAGVHYTKQLLDTLSKDFKIDLVYYRYSNDEKYKIPNDNIRVVKELVVNQSLKMIGWLSLPFLFPLFTSRFSWSLYTFLRKMLKNNSYDFIYLDFSQTFSYALLLNHPNIVMMSHDVILQRYSRTKSKFLCWVRFTEKLLLKRGRVVFTFSKKDSDWIRVHYGVESLSTTFFLSKDVVNAEPNMESNYFVFFAGWDRFDNNEALEWFIDNVLEHIDKHFEFKIIGGGMPERLLEKIRTWDNLTYLGFIDNPYPIIANAIAEIAPLHYGAGVKVKCIDALACGTPIIGSEVAFEGIDVIDSRFMLLASSPDEYVSAINNYKISVEEKRIFKALFFNSYNNKMILNYLNK